VHPYRAAEAVVLRLEAAGPLAGGGQDGAMLGVVAVLSEAGVPRSLLGAASAAPAYGSKRARHVPTAAATG
jgi:hypothetical protein